MFRQPAAFLQHLQSLVPHLALEVGVAEEAEERVGLRALLRFAERLGGAEKRVDVARIAFELRHPARLERIEISSFDQLRGIFREPQARQPPAK